MNLGTDAYQICSPAVTGYHGYRLSTVLSWAHPSTPMSCRELTWSVTCDMCLRACCTPQRVGAAS